MVGDALQWMAIYGQVAGVVDSIGLEVISPNLCSFGNLYQLCWKMANKTGQSNTQY